MLVGFDATGGAYRSTGPANTLGMWRAALLLPDLDRGSRQSATAGIEFLSDPQTMSMGPGLPELRFVCFRGPDHEVIELIEAPTAV